MVGQPATVLCPPERVHEIRAQLEEIRAGRRILNHETVRVRKDGRRIEVALTISPIRGDDGRIAGASVIARDITERRRLESMVTQSEKMSAVGQLAAGVAHEINNPLGVILGFAQGLVRRVQAGDAFEMPLKSIEREAMRCKTLVQDLLTFSRSSQAEMEPMDLNQAVEGALSLVQARAKIGPARLELAMAAGLPHVLGNRTQIQQIVINLANNAFDAMPSGGTLSVRSELAADGPRAWIDLRVSDTGTGIPAEILPRIFEPFFTTKPAGKGTGLGLSLVYEIVKKHGGTVDVQSRPGFTEFRIRLPAHSAAAKGRNPS
jgi:signal transduction histidine kinase